MADPIYHFWNVGEDDAEPTAKAVQVGGSHYKDMGVEPFDVIDTWLPDERIGAYRAKVLKYTMRLRAKDDPLTNAKKALHCLVKLIETLEEIEHEGR